MGVVRSRRGKLVEVVRQLTRRVMCGHRTTQLNGVPDLAFFLLFILLFCSVSVGQVIQIVYCVLKLLIREVSYDESCHAMSTTISNGSEFLPFQGFAVSVTGSTAEALDDLSSHHFKLPGSARSGSPTLKHSM